MIAIPHKAKQFLLVLVKVLIVGLAFFYIYQHLKGDKAISKYASFFDGVTLENMEVAESEIEQAITSIPDELKTAIQLAKSNIEKFHSAQKTEKIPTIF